MSENKEKDGIPQLIYVAREKRPKNPHHFKAGAMNVLVCFLLRVLKHRISVNYTHQIWWKLDIIFFLQSQPIINHGFDVNWTCRREYQEWWQMLLSSWMWTVTCLQTIQRLFFMRCASSLASTKRSSVDLFKHHNNSMVLSRMTLSATNWLSYKMWVLRLRLKYTHLKHFCFYLAFF